jgi:hypothetical protein
MDFPKGKKFAIETLGEKSSHFSERSLLLEIRIGSMIKIGRDEFRQRGARIGIRPKRTAREEINFEPTQEQKRAGR